MSFANGDLKDCLADGTIVYKYAATNATQTTFPSTKIEVFQFVSGQVERHFPDGTREIHFANGTTKRIDGNTGREQIRFPDGTVKVIDPE